jgi:hypothetical protein
MPYFITNKSPDCSGWATIKEDGEVIGCHTTKQDAIDQMVAVSISEDMQPGGERQVSLNVPAYIRSAARKGLDYYGQGLAGDGLVDRTVREARDMSRGEISEDKVIRANAWAARHLVDLEATKNSSSDDKEFPGAGAVAFYLWGINPLDPEPAMNWFMSKADAIKAERTDIARASKVANMEQRDLNENFMWTGHQQALYAQLEDIADTFGQFDQTSGGDGAHYFTENPFKEEGLMCSNCAFYDGAQGCDLVSGVILPDALCKFWIIPTDLIQSRSVPLDIHRRRLNLLADI